MSSCRLFGPLLAVCGHEGIKTAGRGPRGHGGHKQPGSVVVCGPRAVPAVALWPSCRDPSSSCRLAVKTANSAGTRGSGRRLCHQTAGILVPWPSVPLCRAGRDPLVAFTGCLCTRGIRLFVHLHKRDPAVCEGGSRAGCLWPSVPAVVPLAGYF